MNTGECNCSLGCTYSLSSSADSQRGPDRRSGMASHDGGMPKPMSAGEWLSWLTQLTYLPPVPPSRHWEICREVDHQLQGLMSWCIGWQPGHVAENRRLPFTDEVTYCTYWRTGNWKSEIGWHWRLTVIKDFSNS